jgi:hypothetical protein
MEESPLEMARTHKKKADSIKIEMRALMDAGKKSDAVLLMKQFKQEIAEYDSICAANPEIKDQVENVQPVKQK